MAVISINYNEANKKLNYQSVEVSLDNDSKFFDSGDFVKDWFDAMKFLITEEIENVSFSSSVDHFIMDDAPYDSAYLHDENKEWTLKYPDKSDKNWIFSNIDKGIEFFAPKNTKPTWIELKNQYK